MQADFQPCGMCKKQFRSKASLDQHIRVIHHKIKGQLISKCLFGVIVWTKKTRIFFPGFLPLSLKRGQIKKIRVLYYTN